MGRRRGNGEGEVRQRSDGRWEVRLRTDASQGAGSRQSVYGSSRADVVRKLRTLQEAVERGGELSDARTTVEGFLERWLEEVIKPTREHATWRGYATNVRRHIVPCIGRVPLTKLQPVDVQRMINGLRAAGLAPRTIQYAHATLRAGLGVALRWGLVPRNVATLVEPVGVPRRQVVPFRPDEARQLLDASESHRLGAFFTVAMAIGLRPSEALALTWNDVDLQERVIRVRSALERVDGVYRFKEPKSRTSRRTIPLPAVCIDRLIAHRQRQCQEQLANGRDWSYPDLIFTTAAGAPLNRTEVSRQFTRLLRDLGIPHRRLYDCRHTAASILLAQGVAPRVVMEILGHSSYALTMDTYTHVLPVLLRDAAEAMDRRALGDR